MTTSASRTLTDTDFAALLHGVGLDRRRGPESWSTTFADLDLDSLARVELASRIKGRLGVEVEDRVTADSTPAEVLDLVNDLAGARAGLA
ncbi:hypothetical protein Cfla_3332 [Cellulomonas flavigena DSM 20109]|uniref:Carrier domain-containing protein n=1 Tax=Cellulomonas flavigena (strain ATCC 482 / DSM 20109 / BCRC 11376 / JCM 18109 / NBRC 3775 / NCIMB 8073 / NRS 134) TaxID=446466 RepID=D5UC52_CELFN|nr:acyl carrier protein [Cellulomonas flavigena]ADG76211.1 hypothetical protein Cfla_3332 [Cellulomonas flavigena DSM 20109]